SGGRASVPAGRDFGRFPVSATSRRAGAAAGGWGGGAGAGGGPAAGWGWPPAPLGPAGRRRARGRPATRRRPRPWRPTGGGGAALTVRTYWRAAASISSGVACGCRPRSVVMLRHMPPTLRDLVASLGRELGQHRIGVLAVPRHRPERRAEPAVRDRRRQHPHR